VRRRGERRLAAGKFARWITRAERLVSARLRLAAGIAAMLAFVFAENLFDRQLNALFLQFPGIDKVLHTIEYAIVLVYGHWLLGGVTRDARVRAVTAVAAGVTLSLADEGIQHFVAERSVELFDLAADWAGLSLGALVALRPPRRVMVPVAALALATVGYVANDTHRKLGDLAQALTYEHDHEFGKARVHYLRAVASGLRSPNIYNGLAWVTLESGEADPNEALKYAQMAFDQQPGNPDVLDTYGWALHHVGQNEAALANLQEAYKLRPDMYCIHYHLGAVYESLDRPDLAGDHYRRQIELTGTREAAMAARALSRLDKLQR
jgi:tetratricopeptide (TPR) repeat protein